MKLKVYVATDPYTKNILTVSAGKRMQRPKGLHYSWAYEVELDMPDVVSILESA